MSRLRWSLMFRLGWVAMLRFAMSASEAPVYCSAKYGGVITIQHFYLSLAALIVS